VPDASVTSASIFTTLPYNLPKVLGETELDIYGCTLHGIFFAHRHKVYDRYAQICKALGPRLPSVLVPAQLWYGHFRIVVEMDWVSGTELSDAEVKEHFDTIAPAVVWLARKGLLYIDFRGPNLIKNASTGAVRLLDYDDCVLIDPDPDRSRESIASLLLNNKNTASNSLTQNLARHIVDVMTDEQEIRV
jgi:hypothetical protein